MLVAVVFNNWHLLIWDNGPNSVILSTLKLFLKAADDSMYIQQPPIAMTPTNLVTIQ